MSLVKRACDPCHRRKVRCDGRKPCRNCSHASLNCTFNAIPQKKGPKGSRAKVISELRQTQNQTELVARAPPQSLLPPNGLDSWQTLGGGFAKTPGLLSKETVNACVDFFFENMYPTMPILSRTKLQEDLGRMEESVEVYCLASSLCAFMMIQPGMRLLGNQPVTSMTSGRVLLEETLRVRKNYEYIETATTYTVITSFFLFACYFGLDKHNTAWFHLREATTIAQILSMQDEASYLVGDPGESSRKRRLFWLLFVTERAYALQRHRPLTLHSTIALPTVDEDPGESMEISGFLHLVNLFHPFDDTFVGLWNKSRTDCSTAWLNQLQEQLRAALPPYLDSTESQAADLRTSQQWLRTMVWRLSIQNGYLSNSSGDGAMSLRYPLEIARDLVGVTSQLSRSSMEVHGLGLIEKIFDIATTLTDVMTCIPITPHTFELGPRDYLDQCLTLVSTLRGGDSRFLPLLLQKIDTTLPSMISPVAPLLPWVSGDGRIEELYDSGSATDETGLESPASSATLMLEGVPAGIDGLGPTSAAGSAAYLPQSHHQHQHSHSHQQLHQDVKDEDDGLAGVDLVGSVGGVSPWGRWDVQDHHHHQQQLQQHQHTSPPPPTAPPQQPPPPSLPTQMLSQQSQPHPHHIPQHHQQQQQHPHHQIPLGHLQQHHHLHQQHQQQHQFQGL